MPRLVMPDKMITAIIRYDFKSMFRFDQCLYKNDAVTSLPASKEAPINPISIGLAENIDIRPTTEKYAADTDIDKAVKNIIKANIIYRGGNGNVGWKSLILTEPVTVKEVPEPLSSII